MTTKFAKAIDIIRKAFKVFPVVVEVIADVESATEADSPGGAKLTVAEITAIISKNLSKVGEAILALFAKSPAA
jgi:hypothetical protein